MKQQVIQLTEDVTSATTDSIQREVLQYLDAGINEILFDLSDIEIVDSSGIGFFIKVQNTLKQQNGSLSLTGASDDIFSMFKIMRLDKHISIEQ